MQVRPLLLIVRDGWGHNSDVRFNPSNAIYLAKHPVADALSATYPTTLIQTSGFDVGLPEGTMGNSEVGHQNIGAGRVVDQESVAITKQVRDGEFFNNAVLVDAVEHAKETGGKLHLMGIASDAGVHGQLEHLYACLELAKKRGLERVFVHAFTDGRDTPPRSGEHFLQQIEQRMRELGVGQMASISGRYWAMDRDKRWPRVQKAYDALAHGVGPMFESSQAAIEHYYSHPLELNMQGDEFVPPSVIMNESKQPRATIGDGDSVIFYNYRGDRPRELTQAFVLPDFDGFDRGKKLELHFVTLTAYQDGLPVKVAFLKPPKMHNIWGAFIADSKLKQFRCAETEKFPHVTFFFNDYREAPFEGEDRHMATSPKDVSTYDQKPEMAAHEITEIVLKAIASREYALLVVNYANCDMVGHTGNLPAAIQATQIVDGCVGQLIDAIKAIGGSAIVTADHGNAEQMTDPVAGGPHTAHTTNPVEVIIIDDRYLNHTLRGDGRLADIAPTGCFLMGLSPPLEMQGRNLIQNV